MKTDPRTLSIHDFTYGLPDERIASEPPAGRGRSKLLLYKDQQISDHHFYELPSLLDQKHLLVFNSSRVIRARLLFRKPSGSLIEVFCLEPLAMPAETALSAQGSSKWKCLVGNAKRWKEEWLEERYGNAADQIRLRARILKRAEDHFQLEFCWEPTQLSFAEVLETAGLLPLPPYIKRKATDEDLLRYQTVYALEKGSVAAPTAGLHFTPDILRQLDEKNIASVSLSLHVGAGTFKPVSADLMKEHEMHAEHFRIGRPVIEKLLEAKKHGLLITAVGTTSLRTLESLYLLGCKRSADPALIPEIGQWEAYDQDQTYTATEALEHLLKYMDERQISILEASTQIMIAPGFSFKMADALLTNFHQPQSTLLLLVAAFTGGNWKSIYDHALNHDYRFLSYGDSSLLYRNSHGG